MCVDYTGLNKACPKDLFHLPCIDQVVDSTSWCETLYFLNVYSVLVRKVVPTPTSKSTEIYLLMVGAKQLVTRGLSWFRPGLYVQQWCARGTVLRCTVVLAEGSYKRGRRGGRSSRSLRF
jgi:hypothetical protein